MNKYWDLFEDVMKDYTGEKSQLIPLLQKLQDAYGYLPRELITRLSERTGIFISQIMGVATFYSQFSLKPCGKHKIGVCLGTACYVNGSGSLVDKLRHTLKLAPGETSADGKFTLKTTRCVGCCGLAPVLTVGEDIYGKLTPDDVDGILKKYQ